MKPSPRLVALFAVVVIGVPIFAIVGMVALALNIVWLAFAVWFAVCVAWVLTGVLPERWPEDWDDANNDQQARKPNDD